MRIGVIGGGLMGLGVAYRLSERGHAVTVFEKEEQLGGLATFHDYGSFIWDRFYHVILPSDQFLLTFLEDLGLGEKVRWSRSFTGYFQDGVFHSISSSWEFLKFPPLRLWEKLRLAFVLFYCSRLDDWRSLERVKVEDWLIKMCGRRTFERFWRPLLWAKMGEHYRRVSAVFIWSYAKRLFSARESSASSSEHLGYVDGGYRTVLQNLEESIGRIGGNCQTGTTVQRIEQAASGGMWVTVDDDRVHFDRVVLTSPVNVVQKITSEELIEVAADGSQIEYLGAICMVLVTTRPLVPFYVVNIADESIPFTGVIGMSTLVPIEKTGGRYLTFLPKYVLSDDPILRQSDEEIRTLFFEGVSRMFPDLQPGEIESVHINRAARVQPLQVLGYSGLAPRVETRCKDLFLLNTAQFVNGTVNNNNVIRSVEEFMKQQAPTFESPGSGDLPSSVAASV